MGDKEVTKATVLSEEDSKKFLTTYGISSITP